MPSPSVSDHALALAFVRTKVAERFALTIPAFVDLLFTSKAVVGLTGDALAQQLDGMFLDDLYLAAACAQGDERAWQEFDQRHFAFVRSFASRFLPVTRADEVASQVIADLWQRRKVAQFEGRSSLRTWLGAVVTRAALNAAGTRRDESVPLDHPDARTLTASPDTARTLDAGDEGRRLARLLRRAIDRLNDEEKLLVLLHYEQNLTLEQMQPAVGVSKATLSRRLKRLRERLQTDLSTLLRAETGDASIDALKVGIDDARLEFDLSSALRGARRLQGKRGDAV